MARAKKKKTEISSANRKDAKIKSPEKAETDNPFDFGGLPNRDLKKNLGCG